MAQVNLDSLEQVARSDAHDTSRLRAMMAWDAAIYRTDPQLDLELNEEMRTIAESGLSEQNISTEEELVYQEILGNVYNNLGSIYRHMQRVTEAIDLLKKSIALRRNLPSKDDLANSLHNLGNVYDKMDSLDRALEYHAQALEIRQGIGDPVKVGMTYNSLGHIYLKQGLNDKAIEHLIFSLEQAEASQDTNRIMGSHNAIGVVYSSLEDYDNSKKHFEIALSMAQKVSHVVLEVNAINALGTLMMEKESFEEAKAYFEQGIVVAKKGGSLPGLAALHTNLGVYYTQVEQYDSAQHYLEIALDQKIQVHDRAGQAIVYFNLADIQNKKGNLNRAITLSEEGHRLAQEVGFASEIRNSSHALYELYQSAGRFKDALEKLELYVMMEDSLTKEDQQRAAIQASYKYEYGKKSAADSVKHLEEKKVQEAELLRKEAESKRQKAEIKNQRNQQYALFGGLALVMVFALFIFNRFRVTRRQKIVIEGQKVEVERQKEAVEHQKDLVEEKNKEILDSINYAKRLQEAILPPQKLVKEWLPESFVLYKPKDIVAGDFYWMESLNGWIYFAAADCTGHGVPGAMVSVVCSNALSKALIEEGRTKPSELLDRTRELVIERFGRSEEEIKDGMDISLCAFNPDEGRLQWAGANNPLWIVRKSDPAVISTVIERSPAGAKVEQMGDCVFIEVKADKQPIGKYGEEKPFTNHDISLSQGDVLYIFSDGYPDQFGGERGKKYKSGKLKKYFLSIKDQPMVQQRTLLSEEFENWRGDIEQIDDVCVIGVRV